MHERTPKPTYPLDLRLLYSGIREQNRVPSSSCCTLYSKGTAVCWWRWLCEIAVLMLAKGRCLSCASCFFFLLCKAGWVIHLFQWGSAHLALSGNRNIGSCNQHSEFRVSRIFLQQTITRLWLFSPYSVKIGEMSRYWAVSGYRLPHGGRKHVRLACVWAAWGLQLGLSFIVYKHARRIHTSIMNCTNSWITYLHARIPRPGPQRYETAYKIGLFSNKDSRSQEEDLQWNNHNSGFWNQWYSVWFCTFLAIVERLWSFSQTSGVYSLHKWRHFMSSMSVAPRICWKIANEVQQHCDSGFSFRLLEWRCLEEC